MGKFRDMFKVRKPGNGDAVQKNLNNTSKITIADKGKSVPNGGEKKSV